MESQSDKNRHLATPPPLKKWSKPRVKVLNVLRETHSGPYFFPGTPENAVYAEMQDCSKPGHSTVGFPCPPMS